MYAEVQGGGPLCLRYRVISDVVDTDHLQLSFPIFLIKYLSRSAYPSDSLILLKSSRWGEIPG
jgi:hypothetical protein